MESHENTGEDQERTDINNTVTSAEDSELDCDSTDTDSNEEHHDDSLLVPKRAKHTDTGTGHHRKSGFDSTWLKEFKWLEKIVKMMEWAFCVSYVRNMAKYQGARREVGPQSLAIPSEEIR